VYKTYLPVRYKNDIIISLH